MDRNEIVRTSDLDLLRGTSAPHWIRKKCIPIPLGGSIEHIKHFDRIQYIRRQNRYEIVEF